MNIELSQAHVITTVRSQIDNFFDLACILYTEIDNIDLEDTYETK